MEKFVIEKVMQLRRASSYGEKLGNYIKELEEENKKLKETNEKLVKNNCEILQQRIDKAIEYINKFESIRAYFEYTDEDGYDEYDYDDNFRTDLFKILKGEENEKIL